MKLITFPIRLLFRLVVLPIKVVLATAGLTFKTGLKVGALPVKGGFVFSRALGFKAILLFVVGLAGGVAITRRFGAQLGLVEQDGGSAGPDALVVQDTVVVRETADGASVSETVVVDEVVDGAVVSETVMVEEVDIAAVSDGSPLEQVRGADSEDDAERVVDIDAEVAEALGETPGEHA